MQNLVVAICIAIGLLVGLSVQAQTENWQKTDLGEGISIKYPGSPSKREMEGGITLHRLKTADSLSVLTVLIRDLTATGITEEQLIAAAETEEFWQQVQTSALQNLPSSKLLKADRIKVKDLPALSIDMEFPRDGKTNILTQVIFVRGVKSYTVNFNSLDGKGNADTKTLFLSSVDF